MDGLILDDFRRLERRELQHERYVEMINDNFAELINEADLKELAKLWSKVKEFEWTYLYDENRRIYDALNVLCSELNLD